MTGIVLQDVLTACSRLYSQSSWYPSNSLSILMTVMGTESSGCTTLMMFSWTLRMRLAWDWLQSCS